MSPLGYHSETLTELSISDLHAKDFKVLGHLKKLQRLTLTLWHPWPTLTGLEDLPDLEYFSFSCNTLPIKQISSLNSIREAIICSFRHNVPLPSIRDLPEMPNVQYMELNSTCDLEGIDRYNKLLNLKIKGNFEDVSPLVALKELTHLLLETEECPSVAPLANMTNLASVELKTELPPDLTPLAGTPRLHEILVSGTSIRPPELSIVNSLSPPWDDEYKAESPRKLAPLKLRLRRERETREMESPATPRDWGMDRMMGEFERIWFIDKINRRLRRLLGKDWKPVREGYRSPPGRLTVYIIRHEDINRLPEIARSLRGVIAAAKYPWNVMFHINSLAQYERDISEIVEKDDNEFDAERWLRDGREDHDNYMQKKAFLEHEYRRRLNLEAGIPLPPGKTDDEEEEKPEEQEEEDEGWFAERPEYDLGTSLQLYATLNETHLYVWKDKQELAEMLFEIKLEE